MTLNLAISSYPRFLLNLHKSADLRIVADGTSIEIDEFGQPYVISESYIT
jgi:hypothetical protein